MMTESPHKLIGRTLVVSLGAYLVAICASGQIGARATQPTAPVQEGMVKLTDSNIEYFSEGQGEPIVLLPFGGLTVGYMQGLSQDLADAGYRVVRINFRGSWITVFKSWITWERSLRFKYRSTASSAS
jgi:pimeloyl-ACP methyl ester carboxylesterase